MYHQEGKDWHFRDRTGAAPRVLRAVPWGWMGEDRIGIHINMALGTSMQTVGFILNMADIK